MTRSGGTRPVTYRDPVTPLTCDRSRYSQNTSLEQLTPPGEREEASGDERETTAFSRFARDSNRLSMQFGGNTDAMWRYGPAETMDSSDAIGHVVKRLLCHEYDGDGVGG